jgi:hypothetical protein
MYELKAFAQISALINNTSGVIAPVGELSPLAMTYAREKEYYTTAAVPGQALVVFSSKQDGEVVQADSVLAARLLGVSKWIYDTAAAGGFTTNTESFRSKFILRYSEEYTLEGIGAMVTAGGNVRLPGYIDIREQTDDTIRYRIWYSSEVFEQQFDEYQIEVVTPIEDLDVFFEGNLAVKAALAEQTLDITMVKIEEAKAGHPETTLRSEMFEWWDPSNVITRIPTYWSVLIYGIAGNNIDAIKEAIKNYILSNSTHSKEEWAEIFPEIFTATEFVIVPMWGLYSIPNRVLTTGLYSSITSFTAGMTELQRLVKGEGYNEEWIGEKGEMFSTTHKAMNATVVGGPKNRDDIFTLFQRYPDYISVRSTEVDFMRMSPETRRFVLALEEMLLIAETMAPDTSIPVKYSRMVRDGVLYLVTTIDKFQFLVASKYSYEDEGIGLPSDNGEPQGPQ